MNKSGGKKAKSKKVSVPPNYFVAIPVSNPLIHSAATLIQNGVVEADSNFQSAMVSVAKLHVTLMVMRLEDDADIAR